jgi:hypothetical protein
LLLISWTYVIRTMTLSSYFNNYRWAWKRYMIVWHHQ